MKKNYLWSALLGLLATTTVHAQYTSTIPFERQSVFTQSEVVGASAAKSLTLASLSGQDHYIRIAEAEPEPVAVEPAMMESAAPQATAAESSTGSDVADDPDLAALPSPDVDVSFTIDRFITLVRERNEQLLAQKLEVNISREAVNSAWGKFEPEAVASYQHQEIEKNFSAEDIARAPLFSNTTDRNDRYNNYNTSVQGLVPTGGTVSLAYALSETSNLYTTQGNEFQTDLVAEVTQPLLKNAGIKTTMAEINLAETESNIALQTYRQQMMQVVYDASAAYWDLAFAQEKHQLALDSVKIANEILMDSRERLKLGKMAETDVLEAQAGLATRKSQELAARYDVNSAGNYLRNFISASAVDSDRKVVTQSKLVNEELALDLESSVARALNSRPDYIAALKKMEGADIRVAFTQNQRWPQLDLKGSYGLNGLQDSAGDSFDDATNGNDPFWTVGLEFRVPLGGGKKTRSELAAAKHRKRQALLEAKSLETSVKNAVHTSVGNVESTRQQVANYKEVLELKKRLLDVEMARLKQGKSNSQDVLKKEDEYHQAQNEYLSSIVANNKAILGLELVEGSLLQRFAVEVKEESK